MRRAVADAQGAGWDGVMTLANGDIDLLIFWKIFQKAGYPGWYFILLFIPGVNLIALFYFAFTEWPVHKALRDAGIEFPPKKP